MRWGWFASVIAGVCSFVWASDDASIGYALLRRGSTQDALPYIERAWSSDSLDPMSRFLKARLLTDAQAAAAMYLTIAEDEKVADSLRAHCFFLLGSICMAAGDADGAVDYYTRAAQREALFSTSDKLAGDLLALNRLTLAKKIWRKMLGGKDSTSASIGLGLIELQNENTSAASEWFSRALAGAEGANRYRALVHSYRLSCMSGAGKKANTGKERILREFPDGIGVLNTCEGGNITDSKGSSTQHSAAINKDTDGSYTLQVGAFGVKENAVSLKKKLSASFSDIQIVTVKQGSVTLHKVWVGKFSSEQQALTFGEKNLRRRGIRFSVISQ